MATIKVIFRLSGKPGHSEGSLAVRLIQCRRVKTVTIRGCRVYKKEWDPLGQCVIIPAGKEDRRGEYLAGISRLLADELDLLRGYIASLEKEGRYSVDDICELYHMRKDEGKVLGYAESLKRNLSRRGQERTASAYQTAARRIVRFNGGEDIPLEHINARLIEDFEVRLVKEGLSENTISFYMRNLRAIYNRAIADKRISEKPGENPFARVFTGVAATVKRSLSQEEMQQLYDIDFELLRKKEDMTVPRQASLENLKHAHLYFFFSFCTRGMSFVDLAYLRKEDIRQGVLRYIRQKTGQPIELGITPGIQQIIDYFAPEVKDSPFLFPILDATMSEKEQRKQYDAALRVQNDRLKKLAKLAGIKKRISTHWARHTWASIGKKQNLPLRVISECLGHSSEATTQIYLSSLDRSVLDEANNMITSTVFS